MGCQPSVATSSEAFPAHEFLVADVEVRTQPRWLSPDAAFGAPPPSSMPRDDARLGPDPQEGGEALARHPRAEGNGAATPEASSSKKELAHLVPSYDPFFEEADAATCTSCFFFPSR